VYRFGDEFPMSNAVAFQLIRYDLTWPIPVTFEKSSEEALGGLTISACLQEYINDFAILIDRAPQILLLTLDLHEHLTEEKWFAVASVDAP
jgi:hypothetical protein